MGSSQHGLVDSIKTVYRNNKNSVESCGSDKEKADLLVELNVKQQVQNISATDIVQTAWAKVDICGEQDLSNLLIMCFFK
ncbi:unnamed protein product [Rhizophagus irregularis]|uniref:Carbonic anhydrase n=1 Tax=Rhizophagus irregularis TaxID=588596 RepID=A0A2I1GLF8_9GLOM|nr:hypothetical protein RhiirA4_543977 [Rhizophagus irregularis]CAB4444354.1 unnamed protein product [Rhizophagus irregularis]